MKTKFVILLAVLSFTCISCKTPIVSFLSVCYETKETIKLAKEKGYTAISANDLKKMLFNDTTHYKFVIIYSPCCGASEEHMKRTYPQILKKVGKEKVKWYYILDDSGGIKLDEDLRQRCGLTEFGKYYLHDSKFSSDYTSLTDLTNYIFSKEKVKINDDLGIPTNFIVSKDGKLLKSLFVYDDMKAIHPTELYSIWGKNLKEINFNKIDTVRIPYSKHETMQGME